MPIGPPNMASTVLRFCTPVRRLRPAPATVTAQGLKVAPIASDTEVLAHVYPASGKTLAQLPAGYESTRVVEGHSPAEWSLGDEATQVGPDQLVADGARFRLIVARRWLEGPAGARTWTAFVAAEMEDAPPPPPEPDP